MGIVVPETCWASNKICNKKPLLHLVGILFPHTCVISGFPFEVQNFALVAIGNFLSTFRNNLSVSPSCFKNPNKKKNSWTLTMGRIGCPETSVRNYHCSLRNNPKEGSSRLFFSLLFLRTAVNVQMAQGRAKLCKAKNWSLSGHLSRVSKWGLPWLNGAHDAILSDESIRFL